MNRQEAKAAGATRYFGKVCEKHPEYKGEKFVSSKRCVKCSNLDASKRSFEKRQKKYFNNPEYKKEINSKRSFEITKRRKQDPTYKAMHNSRVGARKKRLRNNDPVYNLKCRMRNRLYHALRTSLKGTAKSASTESIIGCSWIELKVHIERQFVDGMSWDNRHLWQVDHIEPLANAKTPEDVYRLSHYTNLQPLWAEDNNKKGAKTLV